MHKHIQMTACHACGGVVYLKLLAFWSAVPLFHWQLEVVFATCRMRIVYQSLTSSSAPCYKSWVLASCWLWFWNRWGQRLHRWDWRKMLWSSLIYWSLSVLRTHPWSRQARRIPSCIASARSWVVWALLAWWGLLATARRVQTSVTGSPGKLRRCEASSSDKTFGRHQSLGTIEAGDKKRKSSVTHPQHDTSVDPKQCNAKKRRNAETVSALQLGLHNSNAKLLILFNAETQVRFNFGDKISDLDVALRTRSSFPTRIVVLKLSSSSWRTTLLSMLSFLSCVGCRRCRFSPFASMSLASHHTFRTRNCSKPRFIHQCQALFCSSPMIHIWDSHENKHKDIMKTWKRHVQCRPYTESQIRAQPSPVRPAQPNPRPTQHSAPTSVSSLFFSKIEPPQVNLFGEKKERWETNINKYLSV